jgi:hypothetical protein
MNSVITSKIAALALGIAGLVLVSIVPASAGSTASVTRQPTTEVRDHRGPTAARDHRTSDKSGGVTVTKTARKRTGVQCLGNLCHVKKVCIGPACI